MDLRRALLRIAGGVVVLGFVAPSASALPAPVASARPAVTSPATERVAVVGDSLVVGTLIYGEPSFLRRALSFTSLRLSPRPSARVGRSVAEGLRVLARSGNLPRIVLVELGTNDWRAGAAGAARWIARVRTIVGPDRDVYWVNLRMSGRRFTAHRAVNVGLARGVAADTAAQLAAGRVGRSVILDWSAFSHVRGVRPGRDGMHYSPNGYHVLARFLAGSLAQHAAYQGFRFPAPALPSVPMPVVAP